MAMGFFGLKELSGDAKAAANKNLLQAAKFIDDHLKKNNKSFLVGDSLTLADVVVASPLAVPYQTTFGADFYKMTAVSAWLERIVGLPVFVRRHGYLKKCAAAPVETTSAPAATDDMDDLFGEEEAPKPKIAIKKKKKEVIAMSLVMLEVKPLDSETDLD